MFCIEMAGIPIGIDNRYEYIERLCRGYEIEGKAPDFTVSVTEEELQKAQDAERPYSSGYLESLCLYRKICLRLAKYQAFLMHSAVVAVDEKAYVFTAPSGTGKTTLFRMIMGIEQPTSGYFTIGQTVKLAYVDQQHKSIDPEKSVYEVISQNSDIITLGNRQIPARAYVARFNFSGADQEKKCGMLSGGERNRLHLALALKEEGNVLLLDEPTNDVDVNTLRALEEGLENFAGCAVVISHDRWFLDRVATHILSFEGDSKVTFYEGSYSEFEEWKRAQGEDVTPHRVKYRKLME